MEIININVEALIPYENNPRKNAKAVDKVAASIREFGFKVPIIVDRDNVIVAGHTRLLAAKKLGLVSVPCIVADDLTEDQIKAFRLADNKVAEFAEWDMEKLIAEIETVNFDMAEFGFDVLEDPAADGEDDFTVEVPDEPRTKLGDVYRLGDHRLMCGDSTIKNNIDVLMAGAKADMVFTDPPYGMRLDADYSGEVTNLKFLKDKHAKRGGKYDNVLGDHDDFSPALIETIFNNFGYCKEVFLWGADYYAELLPDKNAGSWVVWDKRLDESADKMYGSTFELCWSKAKHKRMIARVKWAGIFGTEQEFDKKRSHPTQKPIALVKWFFDYYSMQDKRNVVDLYGGSGSTLISCEQTGRTCYTMELDPKYCDVIVARWEQYTGGKAELITE
jgi:site-specific DNA-methyltransferase (adenine-specific)